MSKTYDYRSNTKHRGTNRRLLQKQAILSTNICSIHGSTTLEFKYSESYIDVVVTVIPYVGPHFDVGKDRIKFQINNMGQVVVESYEHITDYKLPPNWEDIVKKWH
ncbi:hypothetical protein PMSD_13290 [Paenibacillus macquariensis subsp. defensor]|nr:hypothetical protein PMSD_13290 [Paenibacillus macquariensis subsp. defensor]